MPSAMYLLKWWMFDLSGLFGKGEISGMEITIVSSALVVLLAILYYRITKSVEDEKPKVKPVKLIEGLSSGAVAILDAKSDYYNGLKKEDKTLFEKRVKHYMKSKMFTGENGFIVTEEMKILISAAACQISFGLPASSNSNYTHIVISPDLATPIRSATRNSIVIPWKEFVEGFSIADDGQNEGLKILATALIKDNRIQDKAYKILSPKKLAAWEKISIAHSKEFMSGLFEAADQDERVRDEYFAQAVVYFFELPLAMQQKYAPLFTSLAELLRQNTIKKTVSK